MGRWRERGQSAVELALGLLVLLLVLMGCLDLGRAFSAWMSVGSASREGARYASTHPSSADLAGIKSRVRQRAASAGITLQDNQINVSGLGGAAGEPVTVTVSFALPLVSGFLLGGHTVTVHASTVMAIVSGG